MFFVRARNSSFLFLNGIHCGYWVVAFLESGPLDGFDWRTHTENRIEKLDKEILWKNIECVTISTQYKTVNWQVESLGFIESFESLKFCSFQILRDQRVFQSLWDFRVLWVIGVFESFKLLKSPESFETFNMFSSYEFFCF